MLEQIEIDVVVVVLDFGSSQNQYYFVALLSILWSSILFKITPISLGDILATLDISR
jgi:hypothetical protein